MGGSATCHRGGRCVNTTLRLCQRNPLHSVHSRLLTLPISVITENNLLYRIRNNTVREPHKHKFMYIN